MRFRSEEADEIHHGDITPMIDIVFQLIAFFMVLINFAQSEQHEEIQLPSSALAKPPESPLDYPITLHVTKEGNVIFGAQEVSLDKLLPYLRREADILKYQGKQPSEATVIIRAHKDVPAGRVQELMQVCQDARVRFEQFTLRVKEDVGAAGEAGG
jgi:biopolymer transport protein ExbD